MKASSAIIATAAAATSVLSLSFAVAQPLANSAPPGPPPYPPNFGRYIPIYFSGPGSGAAPTGNYYAPPCYFERQAVWDGTTWWVRKFRICR
jgi:hypothetical protein